MAGNKALIKLTWKYFGDPPAALQYYHRAYTCAIKLNNLQKQGELLSAMGNMAWHQGANNEAEEMPGVTWIKSSISESEGKSYCEFEAPNPDMLKEHAEKVGLSVNRITAVEIEVDPSMLR